MQYSFPLRDVIIYLFVNFQKYVIFTLKLPFLPQNKD